MQAANVEQLSQRVKTLRSKMGWSREKLAREIGVSLSTVQRWELKNVKPSRLARRELKKLFKRAGLSNE